MVADKNTRGVFKEIANWKLDAKLEENDRYFFATHDVESLVNGGKCFVIGRKGTGKTAIAQYIKKINEYDYFSKSLSLKTFPFNSLYQLKNDRFTPPNQYITIWKYIIYSNLLFLMSENEAIDAGLTQRIRALIPKDPEKALSKSVMEWVSGGFSAGFNHFSLGLNGARNKIKVDLNWIDRVDVLEDVIIKNIDDAKYFILFDELDEDYKYQSITSENRQYLDLITGLFKAVQDIRSVFHDSGKKVLPVVFLRDDIFDILQDPDKTKWDDFSIYLNWTKYTIQPLLAHRISRSISPDMHKLSFKEAWFTIFENDEILFGKKREKSISIFDWISTSTQLRPRDYIKYLQLCAAQAYESNYYKIRSGVVTTQDVAYSRYLRSEITDEIHSVLPGISAIFEIFISIGKQYLSVDEFRDVYSKRMESGMLPAGSADNVLNILFYFSVIGNHVKNSNKTVFRYLNPSSIFSLEDNIVIHRGLSKSLQIF